ncbi:MAG: hypothetical protein QOE34_1162 [Verrucomicrobiota bacterium]|jgi:sugar lactone lactonase YvrE
MKNIFLVVTASVAATFAPLTAQGLAGYLYESDFSTGTIFQFKPTGEKIPFRTGLTGVRGLAFDHVGNLFVGQEATILKITPGGALSVFASNLHGPDFLAADRANNLFASDREGNVLRFTPLGVKSNFASGLNKPAGLAFDAFGNLFVADYGANAIFKFSPSGAKSTFASGLSGPQGLAFDRFGNLYVANTGMGTVEAYNPIGSRFTSVYNVASPVAVAFDSAGNLFVSSDCNGAGTNSIYKFTPGVQVGAVFASGLGCPLELVVEPARDSLLNVSTRARVDVGPNQEVIGGFIITGTQAKTVLIRAIGPSLAKSGITEPLPDPILELHTPGGTVTNDNWMDSQKTDIQSTGLAPKDDRESAILVTLSPGSYTAIVRGHAEMPSGVAVVEVYDLDLTVDSTLANISTRGFVGTGENVMIGGFIIGGGNGAGKVIIRALGPSLADAGVTGVLSDPTITLRDANGLQLAFNDDWAETQPTEIYETGIPPPNGFESAIVTTLPSGHYTAVVQGVKSGTGVGLIEVYNLR